jgi:nucleoside-diphosphate-sugar epimerase
MVISILGCGWYGKALAKILIQKSVTVKGSTTSQEKLSQLNESGIIPFVVQFENASQNFDPAFFECDRLIVCIPPKLKKGEVSTYLPKIRRIIQAVLHFNIKKVIYISSTGIYGDHHQKVTELDDPMPDTESGSVLWEAESLFRQEKSFKTTIIRFGGLVGPGRHPGRFYAGKKNIPNGLAPVNLVHLSDCIGITMAIIAQNSFGHLFNACSPDHPAKEVFYTDASIKSGYEAPEFLHELNHWKIIDSTNLKPILNYEFQVQNWSDCSFDN